MTRRSTWSGTGSADASPATRSRVLRRLGVTAIVAIGLATGVASAASSATAGWSGLPLPTARSVTSYQVSCASASACFALGASSPDPFVGYRGTRATRLAGPRLGRAANVGALACPSPTACVAVGTSGRSSDHGLLALRWRNGRWSAISVPAGPGASLKQGVYQLTGLSCASPGMCIAVGQVQGVVAKGHGVIRPLLLRFDGRRWSSVRSPLTAGALRSVSCASETDCTAVGDAAGTPRTAGPAVLRLHGGRWTRVGLGSRASRAVGSSLAMVSCPTATRCLATGLIRSADRSSAPTRVVALRETGGGWSPEVPPLPAPVAGERPVDVSDALTGLSCGAPGSCLGVGTSIGGGGPAGGQQHGMSLAFAPNDAQPVAQPRAGVPLSVACPSAAFCLVGGYRSIVRFTP